ncbi:class I SAM-dependent methyltransferase [Methylophaga thalassica]|uniref:class I SAM-dependent methyltransferase n=1 Tax=Methylophaga aminisulfidivorans TaxID=230105 RepID=UPI0024E23746|nr:class I SAM-dependent methyltransferase [Methylophaga aminisulfidivorans]
MYKKVEKCRICGNTNLITVLDLGAQTLTGVFPSSVSQKITEGPLKLVKCHGEADICGLVQLGHSYDLGEMYGDNYGYRSGLNPSMVSHLRQKVEKILALVDIEEGDLIVDIGSNDSTTLQNYPKNGYSLVGVDPTGVKFKEYYPPHIELIPDFFSAALLKEKFPDRKAKIVTSFSMFYDLESPMAFMQDIYDVLADDGIWVFEQSYMPTMLETNSYDTVCHEHLEFYSLHQIKWMTDKVGFKIIDVEFNDVNGGSFSITVAKDSVSLVPNDQIKAILENELALGLNTIEPYHAFAERVSDSREKLLEFISIVRKEGKKVAVLGASTKGNVLLQYCDLNADVIEAVGEVNKEKFSCYTPGTLIPIIPENDLIARKPDYLIVLPWHFREFFLSQQKFSGMNLVFPLPCLDVVEIH